ncbi:20476_t:CDS:2 [Entrophospora sp. SA101]|nr:20476_t:CDS:2 [Entrophospora sp. SA101]
MGVGIFMRNYFKFKPHSEWDFKSFCSFMKILGYDDYSEINIHYKRQIGNIIKDENESDANKSAAQEFKKVKALSKIDSNAFLNSHGKSKDGKKILERLWQVELYCALKEHLYEKANISLEVGRMYCDDGIIDLYIPKMKEHYNRFKEDGKYSLIPMKDYIILDIRQTVMAKKLYPKTWYVVPNNNFTILTILEKGDNLDSM